MSKEKYFLTKKEDENQEKQNKFYCRLPDKLIFYVFNRKINHVYI